LQYSKLCAIPIESSNHALGLYQVRKILHLKLRQLGVSNLLLSETPTRNAIFRKF